MIIRSIFWTSFFRGVGILSAFVVNVVLARILTPDQLGLYFLAFSLAMFASIFMRFGLRQTVIKLVSEARLSGDAIRVPDVIVKVFVIVITSSLLFSILVLSGLGNWVFNVIFKSAELTDSLSVLVMWALVLTIAVPLGEILKGLKMQVWGVALDNSVSSLIALIIFLFVYLLDISVSLIDILVISALSVAIVVLVSIYKLLVTVQGGLVFHSKGYFNIINEAYPVLIINISTYLTANASLWIVGAYLGHVDIAVFGAVLKLFNLIAVPLLVVNIAIEPLISEFLYKNDAKRLDALIRLSASFALLVTIILSVPIIVWGEQLLVTLFGEAFKEGYYSLAILVLGNVINVWTGSCASLMLLNGHQKQLTIIRVIFGLLSILFSISIVQLYGYIGVAYVVSICIALTNIVTWLWVKKSMGLDSSSTFNISERLFVLKT